MKKYLIYLLSLSLVVFSCKEEEEYLDNLPAVTFYPKLSANIVEQGSPVQVQMELTSELEEAGQIVVRISGEGDFTTIPAHDNGQINIEVPAGENTASFTIQANNANYPEGYYASLSINSVSGGVKSVINGEFTLGVVDDDLEAIFEDDFESGNLSKWSTVNVAGGNSWETREFANNSYGVISNFGSSVVAESWLLSPAINFDNYEAEKLRFLSQTAFNNDNLLNVYIITNYDGSNPAAATITTLSPELDPHRGSGFGDFTSSGIMDLSGIEGTGHIAFYYKAIDAQDGSQWQVDDVVLTGININGSEPVDGELISLPFNDDFESCTADFSTPENFIEAIVSGSKTDRGWGCRPSGVDGSRGVRASAFGGETGEDNAWLITKNKVALANVTNGALSFDVKSQFDGPGELKALWSSNYTGSGDPTAATWTEISGLSAQLPAKGSDSFQSVELDLSSISENAYIALQFVGANNSESVSYTVDNYSITADAAGSGGGGGGGSNAASFSTDFEGCSEDFSTPAGFIELFLTAKDDRGWGCRSFGLDGSRAVQASAFGGAEGEDNAWLILENAMDFTGLTSVNFQFQIFSNFSGPGEVIVQYSTDYSGSGAPDAATWTALTAINSAMPAAGSQTWTPINEDIAELGGKTVYIAFQFVGANNAASSSWAIDNLAINAPDAFSGTGGGGSGGGSGTETSIADAKSQMGATVTITGIVTTPDYGFNNGQYFVQDASGGINVYHQGNFGLVSVGDEVTITGTIGEFNALTQIAPSDVTVNSSNNDLPATTVITSADLIATSDLMGSYVEISGVTLVDASQWPTTAIDAGSGVNVDATVNGTTFTIRIDRGESFYDGSTAPSGTFTLKGIMGRFNDEVQILPFLEGDVQ